MAPFGPLTSMEGLTSRSTGMCESDDTSVDKRSGSPANRWSGPRRTTAWRHCQSFCRSASRRANGSKPTSSAGRGPLLQALLPKAASLERALRLVGSSEEQHAHRANKRWRVVGDVHERRAERSEAGSSNERRTIRASQGRRARLSEGTSPTAGARTPRVDDYFGCMRIAPSTRMVSPLTIALP